MECNRFRGLIDVQDDSVAAVHSETAAQVRESGWHRLDLLSTRVSQACSTLGKLECSAYIEMWSRGAWCSAGHDLRHASLLPGNRVSRYGQVRVCISGRCNERQNSRAGVADQTRMSDPPRSMDAIRSMLKAVISTSFSTLSSLKTASSWGVEVSDGGENAARTYC